MRSRLTFIEKQAGMGPPDILPGVEVRVESWSDHVADSYPAVRDFMYTI